MCTARLDAPAPSESRHCPHASLCLHPPRQKRCAGRPPVAPSQPLGCTRRRLPRAPRVRYPRRGFDSWQVAWCGFSACSSPAQKCSDFSASLVELPVAGVTAPNRDDHNDNGGDAKRHRRARRSSTPPQMLWNSEAQAFDDEHCSRPAPPRAVGFVQANVGKRRLEDALPKYPREQVREETKRALATAHTRGRVDGAPRTAARRSRATLRSRAFRRRAPCIGAPG